MNKFLLFLFCLSFGSVLGQERMRVQRCADIDRRVPVKNIYVDEDKNKWVADEEGIFLAQSPDYASVVDLESAEWSLLSVPDGNQELNLPKADLKKFMGDDFTLISTAHLDKRRQELWIGTEDAGLYHFKLSPGLQLIKNITTANSKLRSNNIQTILVSPQGQVLVGTDDGLLVKDGTKSELYGKFFDVTSLAVQNGTIWMVGDGEVLEVEGKNDIYAMAVKSGMVEGDVVDIAFDSQGRLWVASEVVIRYSFDTERYELFGPADGFTSQAVRCIAVDSDDALWAGTKFKGVFFIGKASTMNATLVLDEPLGCDADAKNAAIVVRATGGEPPYTYKWNNNISGEKPKNLGPGSYSVTVSDQFGTTATAEANIEDPRISVQLTMDKEASHGGGTDGQATLVVSGGNPAYKFQWDNGETTKVATKLNAGEHKVTVSDQNACSTEATITIGEQLAPLELVLEQTNQNNCMGDAGASVKALVSGGQAPYNYQWSSGSAKTETLNDLAAGNYSLTATDAVGNTANAEIIIEEPSELTASVSLVASASTNNADGKASVQAIGGNENYRYQWDTNETTVNAEKLAAGSHTVTVTDELGCSVTATIEVGEDILPLAIELNEAAAISCAGENNGAIAVEVSGGKSPFNFSWSEANLSGENPSGLTAGDYQLTVSDAAGNQTEASFSLKEPESLSANITPKAPASTNNADGQATIKVTGGSGKYSFQWDTGESDETAQKLNAGTHSVTVTDEAGCSTTASIEIGEDILPLAIELNEAAAISCAGENNGAIAVEVSGGKGPFNFSWSEANLSGENPSGLAAGDYQLTVSDAAGNQTEASFSLNEPESLTANITPKAPASTNNADGQATIKVTGGSGKYSFQWDTGESDETAQKLNAGTHSVTVTDEAGCSTTASIEIGEDILPLAIELNEASAISCAGENNGAIAVEVSGGKGPFNFSWSEANLSGENPSGLTAGDYQLTVSDAAGNQTEASFTLKEPESLTANITPKAPASTNNADGQATIKVTGGSGKYSFQWDTGESDETAQKLNAGTHSVTVTDEAGCSTTASIEIGEDILPLAIELNEAASISCAGENNGAIAVEVSGGKSPFNFSWSEANLSGENPSGLAAGDYQLTVSDAAGNQTEASFSLNDPESLTANISPKAPASTNNADGQATVKVTGGSGKYSFQWDTGESDETAQKLNAGTHSVTVTDEAGCSTTASIEIGEDILPLAVELNEAAAISCAGENNGAIAVEVSGGKGPFNFNWSEANLSGENPSGLTAGDYQLTVSDAAGNVAEASLNLIAPTALTVSINPKSPANPDQADGEAIALVKGGSGKYTFQWDTGEVNATAVKLDAGTHTVTVTDENACSITSSIEIGEEILPLVVQLKESASIGCAGENNAALSVEINGGKGPFEYQWSIAGINGANATGLSAGDYQITISDAIGTKKTAKINVAEPNPLSVELRQDSPASANNSDGVALAKVRGGSGQYTYRWSNGESNAKAEKLPLGTHSVSISDSNGCSISAEVEIDENILPLRIALKQREEILCSGENNAKIEVSVSGGKSPFKYQWNMEQLDGPLASNLSPSTYTVTVTDATGISKSTKIEITEPRLLSATISKNIPATNENTPNGRASLEVKGGSGNYSYKWDTGEVSASVENLAIGSHSVTITDENNCSISLNFETQKKILPKLDAKRLRTGQTLQVSRLYFIADSTQITSKSYPTLNEIASFLKDNLEVVIEIGGHTNNIPDHDFCDQLSLARAQSVASYITQRGIDPGRIVSKGYGKRKPKFTNKTADGRAKNQRVEIKILSLE